METFTEKRTEEQARHQQMYEEYELFEQGTWLEKPDEQLMEELRQMTRHTQAASLRVLDLGCGIGRNSIPMAKIIGPRGGKVTGVDVLEDALSKLESYSRQYQVEDVITVKKGDIEYIRIPPQSYDVIVAHGCLEHVSSVERFQQALLQLAEAVKPGGLISVVVNTHVREKDAETGEPLEPSLELNMSTSDTMEKMKQQFKDWRIMELSTSPHEVEEVREDRDIRFQHDLIRLTAYCPVSN
ncbi:class I SAM-dependent methyltransferase [Marinicrinis sediminis]|uniref:Class I SAM-dependent methyltransferase n=1 Tax=Marinicrinis sediminis TaxID=1652465 RepID=A0ABW5R832_9BACL